MKKRITLGVILLTASLMGTQAVQAAETSSQDVKTAVVDGQTVQVEAPVKAGKEEAEKTTAPKEALRTINPQVRSRAVESKIPMYRLYNANNGEHFYTQDTNERNNLRNLGWSYEGIGWQNPNSGIAIYRLYNPNSGEHFYTKNAGERDSLTKVGWRSEGIGWYSATTSAYPVYRLFNPNDHKAGSHHYTLNTSERDSLKRVGWRDEGIAWYAAGPSTADNDSSYRLLGVPNYDQYALGAPSGCEGTALFQALQYKGKVKNWSLHQFLNTIPKSPNGNPNYGFVGSPFVENAWTYSAIYPAPLTSWGQQYENVQNISGSSMDTLLNEVKNGNPVVTWVTINFQPVRWGYWSFGVAANNNHAVTLDGYNQSSNQVHVSDSISGSYWLSRTTFETIYNARHYAVAVR